MATPAETARAVKLANERIRPAADKLGQTYFYYGLLLKLASAEDWVTLFSQFNPKEPLPDGSDADGRRPVDAESVKALVVAMQTFVDFMDADGGVLRDLVLKIAVNPERF